MDKPKDRGWGYLADVIESHLDRVPYEGQPDTLCWSEPLEADLKERWEKLAVEDDAKDAVRRAIRGLVSLQRVDEPEDGVWFLVRMRLEWTRDWCRQLESCPPAASGKFAWPRLTGMTLGEALEWLLIEVYEANLRTPRKWWDQSSNEEW